MMMTRRAGVLTALGMYLAGCSTGLVSGPKTVLVAGATGQTGRLVVQQLLAEGYSVRALVRDTAKAQEALGDKVQLVQGDIKEPATLGPAVAHVDAVISAVGAKAARGPDSPEFIDYGGVKNLAEAAAKAKVKQFVLMSSRSVTQENHPLNKMFGDVLKWKLKGENALRGSGVPYTVIRPGGLLPATAPGGQKTVVFEQGDAQAAQTTISRADVATICVQALKYPEARNRTFETNSVTGPPTTDWKAMFAALKADPK